MTMYTQLPLQVYFGDTQDALKARAWEHEGHAAAFEQLRTKLDLEKLVFLRQTHGTTVQQVLSGSTPLELFKREGDILLTDVRRVGIGVLTADCAPVVLIDNSKAVAAIVHAGWRGAVALAIVKALRALHTTHGSLYKNIKAIIGPCARACCYEIGLSVAEQVSAVCGDTLGVLEHRKEKVGFLGPLGGPLGITTQGGFLYFPRSF